MYTLKLSHELRLVTNTQTVDDKSKSLTDSFKFSCRVLETKLLVTAGSPFTKLRKIFILVFQVHFFLLHRGFLHGKLMIVGLGEHAGISRALPFFPHYQPTAKKPLRPKHKASA